MSDLGQMIEMIPRIIRKVQEVASQNRAELDGESIWIGTDRIPLKALHARVIKYLIDHGRSTYKELVENHVCNNPSDTFSAMESQYGGRLKPLLDRPKHHGDGYGVKNITLVGTRS
jgi:hypothetical protein